MKKLLGLLAVVGVLAGCSEKAPPEATSPSPLLSADRDRLWILLRASPVSDGRACDEYYLNRDDARYACRAQQCDGWTRDFADFLRINGFPTIEAAHLTDPTYWQWYLQRRQEKLDCWETIGTLPVDARGTERAEHTRRRNACDPYDDARNNQDLTPADLRIRFN